jgi:predicted RNase H-like HicB family nuclease
MTTNGHTRTAANANGEPPAAEQGALEYLVIVHPAGDLDVPHAARYWTEVPALAACTADGPTVDQAVENTRRAIVRQLAERTAPGAAPTPAPVRLAVELAF